MFRLSSRCTLTLVALSSISLVVLTGCGASTSFSNPSAASSIHGKIFGGQQPIADSSVIVWQVGTTGYGSTATPLASTTTNPDGTFLFAANAYTCTAGEQVYITAIGGQAVTGLDNPNIWLATGLGDCSDAQNATVEINEVSTAVTAFALAQFFTPTLGAASDNSFGTDPADLTAFTLSNKYTIPTLVDVPNGVVNPSTERIQIDSAKIYSLANTLAACVNDGAGFPNCNTLFTDTTNNVRGATVPTNTLQAAVQIARYPYRNVSGLFKLATKTSPFVGLSAAPNDWTIGVSYVSSDFGLAIAGTATSATSASIDIDASGRVWFPSNLPGSGGVGYFDPASGFAGPFLSSYVSSPQYVAIDANGVAWTSDLKGSNFAHVDTANTATVGVLSLKAGLTPGVVSGDSDGDVWFSYLDSSSTPQIGVEQGNTLYPSTATPTYPATSMEVVGDPVGGYYVATASSGSSTPCAVELGGVVASTAPDACTSGGVAYGSAGQDILGAATSLDQLCLYSASNCGPAPAADETVLNLPEGVATDGAGNEWIANSGNASVYTFGVVNSSYTATTPVAYQHGTADGDTMTMPYAIAIDGSGNVWVANASCVTTSATPCTPLYFVLSELIGAANPTITPISAQGLADGSLIGVPPGGAPYEIDGRAKPHALSSRSQPVAVRRGAPLSR